MKQEGAFFRKTNSGQIEVDFQNKVCKIGLGFQIPPNVTYQVFVDAIQEAIAKLCEDVEPHFNRIEPKEEVRPQTQNFTMEDLLRATQQTR